jgi:hypothetical protein
LRQLLLEPHGQLSCTARLLCCNSAHHCHVNLKVHLLLLQAAPPEEAGDQQQQEKNYSA